MVLVGRGGLRGAPCVTRGGSCASVFHGVSDISFRMVCQSLPRLSRACARWSLDSPPSPRRQAARGCKADRLHTPSVRAGAVCVQRLGLGLGLGRAEGFVRRVQGVRRSWPSERYIGAQRRSSLEQKSWVKVLVIRQGAGCRVQRAACRVQRAECRVQGAGCRRGVGARGEGRRRRGAPVHEALRPNPNPNANP